MSIILEGIDMPNSGQIEIIIRPHGKVFSKTRGVSAEAIQIPKRHGKLIPLEDVFRAFPELEPYRQGLTGLTILEAEE